MESIKEMYPKAQLELYICDLSSMDSVRSFCKEFLSKHDRVHYLLNIAGALHGNKREETVDKLMPLFAVNFIAPYMMIVLLFNALKKGAADSGRYSRW